MPELLIFPGAPLSAASANSAQVLQQMWIAGQPETNILNFRMPD